MKAFLKNMSLIIFLIFSNLFLVTLKECYKTEPILKGGSCQLTYCKESQFKTNECSINNAIIKTQWLNNVIRISNNLYRYINVISNKNGDMFIETSPVSSAQNRNFYGLKTNGRPYFQNIELPFYALEELSVGLKRDYSELFNIVLSNNEEYLMSISIDGYVEIYDFDNNQRKYIKTSDFVQEGTTYPSIYNHGFTYEYENNYYIIFPFYTHTVNSVFGEGDYLYFQRYRFDSIDITDSNSYEKSESGFYLNSLQGQIVSCFNSDSYIFCFFQHYDFSLVVNLYDYYLNYLGYFNSICTDIDDLYSFFKGIHLKNDIKIGRASCRERV